MDRHVRPLGQLGRDLVRDQVDVVAPIRQIRRQQRNWRGLARPSSQNQRSRSETVPSSIFVKFWEVIRWGLRWVSEERPFYPATPTATRQPDSCVS